MEVLTYPGSGARPGPGSAVGIGAFDGLHLGHRAVIHEIQRLAEERQCQTAVVTFDRHPATVVRPESAPRLLTDLDQKLELLEEAGVDVTLVVRFDAERSQETAEDFAREVLVECLRAQAVVVGHDFHFGHRRGGNVALLARMGGEHGFTVLGLNLVAEGDDAVSSTRIRRLLGEGRVEEAARLLDRPHEVRGQVVAGDRRGREMGFPTANIGVPAEILVPADGIYAAWYVRPDGSALPAAVSVGRRPTFYADAPVSLVEAHLLDFDGDLYGELARLRFVARLRGEEKYDSMAALVDQIHRDVDATRTALGRPPTS